MHVIGGQCRAVEGRGGYVKEMEEAARKIEGAVAERRKRRWTRKKEKARGMDKQAQEEKRELSLPGRQNGGSSNPSG